MPEEFTALVGILAALSAGVVSPGPSFIMVARAAVSSSRSQALGAALGMGAGGFLFAGLALLGLQGVFLAIPSLYVALKVLGGLYLCYIGFLIFRSARQPLSIQAEGQRQVDSKRSFWLGLSTQLSNPKTAIVYASVFAAFLPEKFSVGFASILLFLVFLIETIWYAMVALVLSSAAPQKMYLACKLWIDRTAGVVMLGLGLRLVASASSA
jgi:threonine/homoserine/homoserine lactone efflux protein